MKSFRHGAITFRKISDFATGEPSLSIQLLDEAGAAVGELEIKANAITNPDERTAVDLFSFWVEEAPRKAAYFEEYAEHGNMERVRAAIREDFDAHAFRTRRDRGHYEGLGDDALRRWHLQR